MKLTAFAIIKYFSKLVISAKIKGFFWWLTMGLSTSGFEILPFSFHVAYAKQRIFTQWKVDKNYNISQFFTHCPFGCSANLHFKGGNSWWKSHTDNSFIWSCPLWKTRESLSGWKDTRAILCMWPVSCKFTTRTRICVTIFLMKGGWKKFILIKLRRIFK